MIVSNQGSSAVCIGANHTNRLEFIFTKREYSIVFQQNDTFSGRTSRYRKVLFALNNIIGNLIKLGHLKHSQQVTCGKQTDGRALDMFQW